MAEALDAILSRLGRAEDHLETIKRELVSYYNGGGHVITAEYKPDADGGKGAIDDGFVTIPEISPSLNTLIGEFIHNLHSALEHLAWQLVLNSKKTPTQYTKFPIAHVEPAPNKEGKRRIPGVAGGVSPDARALIGAAQPYKWGDRYTDHPLWLLHQLWNIDKHRHVLAQGCHTAIKLPLYAPPFKFTSKLIPESVSEHGAKLTLVPTDPDVDVNTETVVQVGIHEPSYGIERPLLRTLEEVLKAVDGLVEVAQATCF